LLREEHERPEAHGSTGTLKQILHSLKSRAFKTVFVQPYKQFFKDCFPSPEAAQGSTAPGINYAQSMMMMSFICSL